MSDLKEFTFMKETDQVPDLGSFHSGGTRAGQPESAQVSPVSPGKEQALHPQVMGGR